MEGGTVVAGTGTVANVVVADDDFFAVDDVAVEPPPRPQPAIRRMRATEDGTTTREARMPTG